MVDVLVILDGASEPLRDGGEPTSLELARTPVLDRLAREGELTRLNTIDDGLTPGSEAAIPALLGWTPTAPVDRGALEAAAHGIALREGRRAWRVDVLGRPDAATVALVAAAVRAGAPEHEVHHLRGHRLLVVGAPPLPLPLPLDAVARVRVWPAGVVPPRLLDVDTVLVGARGAAVGAAALMGAATIVPTGATGGPDTDLVAKAFAAIRAIDTGARRVIVHVGAPDEAAHMLDRAAKVAAIERVDRELLAPLVAAAASARGGSLRVCPDHGCDPRTGEHDAAPVPCVTWSPAGVALRRELERAVAGGREARRLTERAVAHLAAVDLPTAALAAA